MENKIVFENFIYLYQDLIKDERNHVEEELENNTNITEEDFYKKYKEDLDAVPLNLLKSSHYKSLRMVYEFLFKILKKN